MAPCDFNAATDKVDVLETKVEKLTTDVDELRRLIVTISASSPKPLPGPARDHGNEETKPTTNEQEAVILDFVKSLGYKTIGLMNCRYINKHCVVGSLLETRLVFKLTRKEMVISQFECRGVKPNVIKTVQTPVAIRNLFWSSTTPLISTSGFVDE